MTTHDEEGPISRPVNFGSIAVRHGFIRRVLAIVMSQLITVITVILLINWQVKPDRVREYLADVHNQVWAFLLAFALFAAYVICAFVIHNVPDFLRRLPVKFILLIVITVFLTGCTYMMTKTFESGDQFFALLIGIILFCCVGILGFTFTRKHYIFSRQGVAFCSLWILFCCSYLIPAPNAWISTKIVLGCLVILSMCLLLRAIHWTVCLSPHTGLTSEDYFLGALLVYGLGCWMGLCVDDEKFGEHRMSPPFIAHFSNEDESGNPSTVRIEEPQAASNDRRDAGNSDRPLERLSIPHRMPIPASYALRNI